MGGLDERVRAWTYGRQCLGRAAPDARTALEAVVAVYASQPTAVLSLAARVARLDAADYRAFDVDHSAVRIPAMRGSAHLIPSANAARVFAATRWSAEKLAWLWRSVGLSDAEYSELKRAVVEAAHEPITVAELRRRLTGSAGTLLGRHPQAPTLLVRAIRSEGLLLAVAPDGLRSNAFAYVATDAWLGVPLDPVDPEQALAWLAGEYLRAFGPVRVEDFRWWAGTTTERARAAMAAHDTVKLGDDLLLRAADREAFERAKRVSPETLDLLPLWDMYTMGYAPDGRARLVRREHMARAYGGGDGLGLVLRAGLAVAAWGSRFAGRRLEVSIDFFEPPATELRRRLDERLGEVAALLGATDIALREGPLDGRGRAQVTG